MATLQSSGCRLPQSGVEALSSRRAVAGARLPAGRASVRAASRELVQTLAAAASGASAPGSAAYAARQRTGGAGRSACRFGAVLCRQLICCTPRPRLRLPRGPRGVHVHSAPRPQLQRAVRPGERMRGAVQILRTGLLPPPPRRGAAACARSARRGSGAPARVDDAPSGPLHAGARLARRRFAYLPLTTVSRSLRHAQAYRDLAKQHPSFRERCVRRWLRMSPALCMCAC